MASLFSPVIWKKADLLVIGIIRRNTLAKYKLPVPGVGSLRKLSPLPPPPLVILEYLLCARCFCICFLIQSFGKSFRWVSFLHLAQSSAVISTGSGLFPTRTALLSWVSHKITRLTLTPECSQQSDQNGDCLHFVLRGPGPGRFRRCAGSPGPRVFCPLSPDGRRQGLPFWDSVVDGIRCLNPGSRTLKVTCPNWRPTI